MVALKILITGGAGFIGKHLTAHLRQSGHWVRWLDTLDPQIHGPEAAKQADYSQKVDEMILGDVCIRENWKRALQDIDAVIHLAAQTGTGQSMYRVGYYTEVNVGGTALLWDILVNEPTKVKKVVVASSRSIYGEGAYACRGMCGSVVPEPRTKNQLARGQWELACPCCGQAAVALATPETSTPKPASLYACTKLAQEQISLTMGKTLDISTVVLRFQNVFGPGQSLRNPYTGIISIFSNQMRQNLPINIYEDGQETRDFVFVDDVANACTQALTLDCNTAIFNVGSGKPICVLDLAHTLKQLWGSSSTISITGDYRVGDIRHNWADISRLRSVWSNWPVTDFYTGLEKFVEWARQQAIFEDQSEIATVELKRRNL
jgi:dTDP-L-rhamnose 4-epimerase